jgi:hypothetical protein
MKLLYLITFARGLCPVEELVHGGDTVPPHGGHIPARQDGVVHLRVHGQLLGKHRLSGSGRPVEQQVPVHPTVQPCMRERERDNVMH